MASEIFIPQTIQIPDMYNVYKFQSQKMLANVSDRNNID